MHSQLSDMGSQTYRDAEGDAKSDEDDRLVKKVKEKICEGFEGKLVVEGGGLCAGKNMFGDLMKSNGELCEVKRYDDRPLRHQPTRKDHNARLMFDHRDSNITAHARPEGYTSRTVLFPVPSPPLPWTGPASGHLTLALACGQTFEHNEHVAAIPWDLYDLGKEVAGSVLQEGTKGYITDGPSVICNRFVRLWIGEGYQVMFVVKDRCTACNVTHSDIQTGVFKN
ncbi:hypothetical protein K458DRAFT_404223 [Lentithecium fluviatile CBS 122367]|uniref:Uncharacterized protein n=1 Tax=Lentithecium fluviatile CBS 122367 TaxID=1168545 RepID=A0A6G1J327_9PLEO|nr:hypothetical protein K458DRAFT_404223 [Lentithecium fluviatile CBS 122367]